MKTSKFSLVSVYESGLVVISKTKAVTKLVEDQIVCAAYKMIERVINKMIMEN